MRSLQLLALGLAAAASPALPGAAWAGPVPDRAAQSGRPAPTAAPAEPGIARLWGALSAGVAATVAASSPVYALNPKVEPPQAPGEIGAQVSPLPAIFGVVIIGAVLASVLVEGGEDKKTKEKPKAEWERIWEANQRQLEGNQRQLAFQQRKVDDKQEVKDYFNGEGFGRWKNIYGDTDDVNPVQKDIRVGHAETVKKILDWVDGGEIAGRTVCDAGCGTGNLSIPLAQRGAMVSGSDISDAMVSEAQRRAQEQLEESQMPRFETRDLEALDGEYDTVCCVDVLIHYPPERLNSMVGRLANLAKGRVILSFAPKTWYYTLLKQIGELFPGKSKTTRAYLHEEEVVEDALRRAGFEITRREMTATNFYFSRLFEARPVASSASS